MGKMVRKLPIDDFWNIGKTESWFSDMASQGLHLTSVGRWFVYFERGEASEKKYRIDVLYDKPSQEQLDIYREYGWDFAAKAGFFHIFSSPKDSNSPELHTDPIEQGITLKGLDRILKKNIIVFALATLIMTIIIFALNYFDDQPFLTMVEGDYIILMFFIVVYLYGTYATIRNYIYVRKTKNALTNGRQINHQENWKKKSILNTIVDTVVIIVAASIVFIPILQMIKRDEYSLPTNKGNLPIISLGDIEENPNFHREVIYNDQGIDINNNVRYQWSPLAPTMYEIHEGGTVEGMVWTDRSGEYSPSIYTKYYQLSIERMADGVLSDLMNGVLYDPRYNEPQEINSSKFDQLYVVERNNSDLTKLIFASLDNKVIYIRYHGNQKVDKIISLLSELKF